MFTRMGSPTILAAPILLLTLLHSALAATVLSPFTSRPIPVHLLRHWTGDHNSSPAQLLYELSPNGTLYTPSNSIAILNLARPLSLNSNTSYTLNGAETNPAYKSMQVRKGAGYTVLFNIRTRQVVRLWGHNLHLSLPNPELYPFILVDTPVSILRNVEASLSSSIRAQIPPHLKPLLRQSRPCSVDIDHHVEVLIAYDNTFCVQNGNDESVANAFVQAMINQADRIYRDETCIRLTLSHIDAHCRDRNDPYTLRRLIRRVPPSVRNDNRNTNADFVLFGFRNYWESGPAPRNIPRDAAYLFTNYIPDPRILGIAFAGAICGNSHYGWVQNGALGTFVHESGHTLSAEHSPSGIMTAFAMPGSRITFSATSVNEINTFVDDFQRNTRGSDDTSCIRPRPPPRCDSTVCPGRCIRNQCMVSFTRDAAARGLIPCTPVRSPFFCVRRERFDQPARRLSIASECPRNFEFLRLRRTDTNALCCNPPSATRAVDIILKDNIFFNQLVTNNGQPEEAVNIVDDTSLISRRQTIMRTTIDPTCGLSEADNPSPSPTPAPSGRTCGEALGASQTLLCQRRSLGIRVSSPSQHVVQFFYEQRNGNISIQVRVARTGRIRSVASVFSTAFVTVEEVGAAEPVGGATGSQVATVSVNAFGLRLTSGDESCCGVRLFAALSVVVCNTVGATCDTVGFEGRGTTSCVTCSGNRVALHPSETVRCGRCVRS